MDENTTREMLKEWRVESVLPPNFDSGVWRRIEAARPVNIGALISDWFTNLFSRPAVAFSYVAVALVVGLAAGQAQASRELQSAALQAKSKYIQSIDPYAKPLSR